MLAYKFKYLKYFKLICKPNSNTENPYVGEREIDMNHYTRTCKSSGQ